MSRELQKIESFKYELAVAETYDAFKKITNKTDLMAEWARTNKVSLDKQNELGEFRVEIEERYGEWLDEHFPHGGDRKSDNIKVAQGNLDMPASKEESARARKIKDTPKEVKRKIMDGIIKKKDVITPAKVEKAINLLNKHEKKLQEDKDYQVIVPKIYKAECMNFIKKVQPIDLLITDPPYFTDGYFTAEISAYLEKVKPTGQAYIFMSADPDEVNAYLNIDTHHMTLAQILVWNYNNTGQRQPNEKYTSNYQLCFYYRGAESNNINKPSDGKEQYACQTINAPDGRQGDRHHKWQKPGELMMRLIRNSSNEGDYVCDPFAGSGTIIVEAGKLGRNAEGCDIDQDAIDICIERGCKYVD